MIWWKLRLNLWCICHCVHSGHDEHLLPGKILLFLLLCSLFSDGIRCFLAKSPESHLLLFLFYLQGHPRQADVCLFAVDVFLNPAVTDYRLLIDADVISPAMYLYPV